MADLRVGETPKIRIEILDGGDLDTVRFKLAGVLDPEAPYEMPRQELEAHIERELLVERAQDDANEPEGNPPF
ncbi:hypothetical protein [Aeromonas sp. R7-5]|uniref:hypothetical protein n=1 Tax=Aeromonas sp. R7-5 TaxID=3138477 RepID=UPI0034A4ADA8